jgi:thiosulfate/3-mercaptopyruvate sulfurtransferase
VPRQRYAAERRHTRRDVLNVGIAAGLGAAALNAQSVAAGATPEAGGGYARPELLIDGPSLRSRRNDPGIALIALMPPDEFAAGHIPRSAQIDWPDLEIIDTSEAAITEWRDAMAWRLGTLGIAPETTVVTYDGGTLFATRPWWVLRYLGHQDVRVLNGGLAAWAATGGEVVADAVRATPAAAGGYRGAPQPEVLAALTEVQASLDDPNVVIIDARTPEEYAEGHIPGAVNVNFPRNAAAEPPKTWLPQDELLAMYAEVGATPDKRIIPYCTTGVRSSVTYFTLRLIGYEDVALYTGSWEEWINRPDTPRTTGSEP